MYPLYFSNTILTVDLKPAHVSRMKQGCKYQELKELRVVKRPSVFLQDTLDYLFKILALIQLR